MNKIQKKNNELIDYTKLVISAMVCIYVIYFVAESLVGDVPAKIGSIILSVAGVAMFSLSKKVRNEMLSWVRKK